MGLGKLSEQAGVDQSKPQGKFCAQRVFGVTKASCD